MRLTVELPEILSQQETLLFMSCAAKSLVSTEHKRQPTIKRRIYSGKLEGKRVEVCTHITTVEDGYICAVDWSTAAKQEDCA